MPALIVVLQVTGSAMFAFCYCISVAFLSRTFAHGFARGDLVIGMMVAVPYARTLADIRRALEEGGIEFIPENGGGPGARLRKPATVRKVKKDAAPKAAELASPRDRSGDRQGHT